MGLILGYTECIIRVERGETPPYRPVLPSVEGDTNPEVVALMEACWQETPADRPSVGAISKRLRTLNKGT